jgi:hypothetical protein
MWQCRWANAPLKADDRVVPGHWEGDFIKGVRHVGAVGTAAE